MRHGIIMAKSMTAYGRSVGTTETKAVTVEIKSVNSRYLDLQVKVSRGFTFLEEKIKQLLQTRISRGKVDFYLGIDVIKDSATHLSVDTAYAASYVSALKQLRDLYSLTDDISVMTVAQNKDVFKTVKDEEDETAVWNEVLPFINDALDRFDAMKRAEGENIRADLLAKKENIKIMADAVASKSEECTASYKEKFEARLRKLISDNSIMIDEQRILTECAIYTDKVAIDEELVRLDSHFKAFEDIFSLDEPIGRKLDFLLQEMNRETNTIGSKCSDAEIAHIVVDIKCELEKIREQVQNLE